MARIRLQKSSIHLLTATLALLFLHAPAASAQQDISTLISRIDDLYNSGDYAGALGILRPALRENPANYDLLCRMAETLTDQTRIIAKTAKKDEVETRYEEAVTYARRAVEANNRDAEGWFQVGKALGRLALYRGGKEKVNMSKEVKEDFEKSLSFDRQHPGALHGLARWHREVANLSWILKTAAKIVYGGLPPASNEEAVRFFKEALTVEPETITHHLELGKTYLEMKEKELARTEFETVLRLPASDPDDPEWKEEAEQLLAKIRK